MRSWKLRLSLENKTAVYAQIILVLVMLWLRDVLHFPAAITYVTDVLLLILLFTCLHGKKKLAIFKDTVPQYIIVLAILFCMIFSAIVNFVEPLLVMWGLRNNLRFFLFFFICISLLDIQDVNALIRLLKKFFWINVVMCTIQYFFFGLMGDYLGGLFGIEKGCNAYLNVFICMIFAIVLADFYTSKTKVRYLFLYVAFLLYLAFLAELKVFYFEIVLIAMVTAVLLKPSVKTVAFSLAFFVVLIVGAVMLLMYDPNGFNFLFDHDALEFYLGGNGYTNSGDLNRFTAIGQIYSQFFEGNSFLSLFGFGLGSCEYSQYSFLQSEFSQVYGDLNYRWFTHAWVYLEQGLIGIILLIVFFISLLIYAVKRINSEHKYYMVIAVAFLPVCLLGMMYNSAIQIEACYLMAFMCAMPYIASKSRDNDG